MSNHKCPSKANSSSFTKDVPWDSETYLHRIGRAGRFGSYGISVALPVTGMELDLLRNIVHKTGSSISIIPFELKSSHSLPDLWKVQQVWMVSNHCRWNLLNVWLHQFVNCVHSLLFTSIPISFMNSILIWQFQQKLELQLIGKSS